MRCECARRADAPLGQQAARRAEGRYNSALMKRRYYSLRTGRNPKSAEIDLKTVKALFLSAYLQWSDGGYFQEHFGYWCVDSGDVPGSLGSDIPAAILFHLRKEQLWPIKESIETYKEDDLFDMIEFLCDHISKPVDGRFHNYFACGWHYNTFDAVAGKREFRLRVNDLLETYGSGFELSETGEILELAQPGTEQLLEADIPSSDMNVVSRVQGAIAKFRRYRSSAAERRDAIRDLADVLEYLRPQVKRVLTKADESDLFNLANNFGIRHHNKQQKTDYDSGIWLSWMFYFYLSTIHACLRLLKKQRDRPPRSES